MTTDKFAEKIREKFFKVGGLNDFLTRLEEFIDERSIGWEGRIGSLTGESQVGKTHLVRAFATAMNERASPGSIPPVVIVELLAPVTIKSLFEVCLAALGAPILRSETIPAMERRVVHFLKEGGVRLLVLDEFQHLKRVKGSPLDLLCDTIKSLVNKSRLPILAVGTREVHRILQHDPQVNSRHTMAIELHPFAGPDGATRDSQPTYAQFRAAVKALVTGRPSGEAGIFEQPENLAALHAACRGYWRRLVDLIQETQKVAKTDRVSEVTSEHLQTAICRMPPLLVERSLVDLQDNELPTPREQKLIRQRRRTKTLKIAGQVAMKKAG
ncbi:MAG: TniB family NTP-binding protein [Magnetospirillum sp.]|nr:TniB family NTP-binding protein [Magnetospirillum sp.]